MERPSNLIIAFVLAIAGLFFAFALGRMAVFVFPNTDNEVEVESDFESRQELNSLLAKSI